MSVSTKREFCESEASSPLTQTLSPTTENGLGERAEIYGNAEPGRPQRGRRSPAPAAGAALSYCRTPRWGCIRKKRPPAASQMSNLHNPALKRGVNGKITAVALTVEIR
jgi:hypothetical protein